MTESKSQLNALFQQAEQCGRTTLELYKLNGVSSVSKLIATCAFFLILGICLLIALLFLSIGAAFWIGNTMENMLNGFMIVSLVYVILAFLVYQFGAGSIKRLVRNAMISILLKSSANGN